MSLGSVNVKVTNLEENFNNWYNYDRNRQTAAQNKHDIKGLKQWLKELIEYMRAAARAGIRIEKRIANDYKWLALNILDAEAYYYFD